jgi:hypothetical protein
MVWTCGRAAVARIRDHVMIIIDPGLAVVALDPAFATFKSLQKNQPTGQFSTAMS